MIFIIDDDPIFILLSTLFIERVYPGKDLETYNSAISALDHILANIDDRSKLPELIFLDLRMPMMNGFEFLEQLTPYEDKLLGLVDIVVLTSSLYTSDQTKAFQFPLVKCFLEKPITIEKLIEVQQKRIADHTNRR